MLVERKRRGRYFLPLILVFLIAGRSLAQTPQPWLLGVYAQGGFIMAHTELVDHLAVSHPLGFELNFQKQTNGKKAWHQLYKFPKIGYSFDYLNYHNPVLGQSFAASTYINKTMRKGRRSEFNFRLGAGLGYLTNPYNQESNHKNMAIGTGLNATLQTRFEYDYYIGNHCSLLVGLGLNHYSNGASGKPNFGINIPTLSLGMNYRTQPDFAKTEQPLPDFDARFFYTVSTSAGLRQISVSFPEKYWVQSLSLAVGKPLNRKSNLILGIDGFYDRSIKVQQQHNPLLAGEPFPDTKKGGLYLGHELLFGSLAFESQLGFYVYRPYKFGTPYYERLGLKYHITPKIFGAVDLKIHGFAADVLEWRVGYRF